MPYDKNFRTGLTIGRRCHAQKFVILVLLMTVIFCIYEVAVVRFSFKDAFNVGHMEQCEPKTKIAFLKTHKTAGSTVQNIFLRYADKHNLTLVIPRVNNYIGHPDLFHRYMVPRLDRDVSYSILCHHTRFNYQEIRRVLPGDLVFITILRDPATLFESLYSYYQLYTMYRNKTLIQLAHVNMTRRYLLNQRYYRRIGRNQMSFDLGLSEEFFEDTQAVLDFVHTLDSQFHLVMITERMDESLVLLRHLLCWDVADVVTFRHNVRISSIKPQKNAFDGETMHGLRILNAADQVLYDYFHRRFLNLIDEFGVERMKREVDELRAQVSYWYEYCVENEVRSHTLDKKFKSHNSNVLGFKLRTNVTEKVCESLAKAELPYTAELRAKQGHFYPRNSSPFRYSDPS